METSIKIYSHLGKTPIISRGCFVAPDACLIGEVHLHEDSSVWFGCVIRGDINSISIGERTNVQDLSILHVTEKHKVKIGKEVTIGHRVTVHGCEIGDNCLIGMNSVIMDGVKIGKNCLVAAGSLLPPGKVYPEGQLIIGSPAVAKRELSEEEKELYGNHYKNYILNKNNFLKPNGLISLPKI